MSLNRLHRYAVEPPRAALRRRADWRARLLRGCLLFMALGAMMLADANVQADSYDDRRVRAGARLFRTLLAADVALETKTAADGALHIVVLGGDRQTAGELSALIAPPEDEAKARIRGLAVRVDIRDVLRDMRNDNTADSSEPRLVGIFLAAPPTAAELDRLIRWSIEHRVILYSPFEGHVERGATAGISIEAKVQPYLNAATVEASGLDLKPFFLKVAKVFR